MFVCIIENIIFYLDFMKENWKRNFEHFEVSRPNTDLNINQNILLKNTNNFNDQTAREFFLSFFSSLL